MSFYIYDITFLVLFSLTIGIFLWKKRHNLKREGIMYLYRTRVGVKFIDYIGKKYKKTLSVLGFLGVIVGYLLMISMMYLLWQLVYIYLFKPEFVRVIKIPPIMPLIPYLPEAFKISFLPPFYFTYWIIAIAVIALFHEFAHGIMMKRYNIGIKSTGFGFLGPFLAAFVEQDEKEMEKAGKYQQIAVLSAGVFTNFILAIFFFLMLSVFFVFSYVPSGYLFNTYTPGIIEINSITNVGEIPLEETTRDKIMKLITEKNLTNDFILGSNGKTIRLTKIIANNKSYYTTVEKLKIQLERESNEIVLYEDLPAINLGLRGVIIKINEYEIKDSDDLTLIMKKFKSEDKIKVITRDLNDKGEKEILEYEVVLAEDPVFERKGLEKEFYSEKETKGENKRGVIGIGYSGSDGGTLGSFTNMFNFFKKPATSYEPRFNADLILFIYNLIWWLALINLSVALINMWPVGIFDGGRMFMLTVWAITGSERFGNFAFKIATYIILGALMVLMVGWFVAVF